MSPKTQRTALAIVVVTICALAFCSVYWYLELQKGAEDRRIWQAMHRQVRNGDALSQVQTVLGPGSISSGVKASRLSRDILLQDTPGSEIRPGDAILTYKTTDAEGRECQYFLHFRDNVLINHDPQRYSNEPPVISTIQ